MILIRMSQTIDNRAVYIEALQWHLDHEAADVLLDEPTDRTAMPDIKKMTEGLKTLPASPSVINQSKAETSSAPEANAPNIMGAAEAVTVAQKLAREAEDLDALKKAIADFDGISLKKTASNLVFGDGNPQADVMIIGEAPAAEEDVQGKPFVGENGQLLDKIMACIDLERQSHEPDKSFYITNILNWRPPGNRTPTQSEIDVSLPFIERHIALVQPKAVILLGGVAAKGLLRRSESISKLRGVFHAYKVPETLGGNLDDAAIPVMATYHPAYLIQTPAQKKAVWQDILIFQEKLKDLYG